MTTIFYNYTPHSITLNSGEKYDSVGVARVRNTFSEVDDNGICSVSYGDITGLPEPKDGCIYIVSALVLAAAKAAGRTDCVAPATGHPDCLRKDGFIAPCLGGLTEENLPVRGQSSNEGVDGFTSDGRSVQVKASGTAGGAAFRLVETTADHLLFFHFNYDECFGEVIYNGPEERPGANVRIEWPRSRMEAIKRK